MTKQNGTAMTTQPSPTLQLQAFLEKRSKHLAKWAQHNVDPATLIRFALMDYSKSTRLQQCSMDSIYLALVACAQAGLEPGGIRQEAFIIPYGKTATFQMGYRGVVKLAYASDLINRISANVVYEEDTFDIDLGSDPYIKHKPALGARGPITGAYAYAKLSTGELEAEYMERQQLDQIREHATQHGESDAWANWESEMYRKAPLRRLAKRLPLSDKFAMAAHVDDLGNTGDTRAIAQTLGVAMSEATPQEGVAGLKAQLKSPAATTQAEHEGVDEPPDAREPGSDG